MTKATKIVPTLGAEKCPAICDTHTYSGYLFGGNAIDMFGGATERLKLWVDKVNAIHYTTDDGEGDYLRFEFNQSLFKLGIMCIDGKYLIGLYSGTPNQDDMIARLALNRVLNVIRGHVSVAYDRRAVIGEFNDREYYLMKNMDAALTLINDRIDVLHGSDKRIMVNEPPEATDDGPLVLCEQNLFEQIYYHFQTRNDFAKDMADLSKRAVSMITAVL